MTSSIGLRLRWYHLDIYRNTFSLWFTLTSEEILWTPIYLPDWHMTIVLDVVTLYFCWLISTSNAITLCISHSKIEFLPTCFWSQLFTCTCGQYYFYYQHMWINSIFNHTDISLSVNKYISDNVMQWNKCHGIQMVLVLVEYKQIQVDLKVRKNMTF